MFHIIILFVLIIAHRICLSWLDNKKKSNLRLHPQEKCFNEYHREDKAALTAYLEKRHQRTHRVITKVDDPDFDTKIASAVFEQLNQQ